MTIAIRYVRLGAFLARKTAMASFIEAVGESINRAACVALGNFATSLEVLQYVLDPLATSPNYNGAAAVYAARCGLPLPSGYIPDAGFEGGQCVGVSYRIDFTVDFVTGVTPPNVPVSTPESGTVIRNGAITSFSVENNATECGYRLVSTAGSEFIGRATFPEFNRQELRNLRNVTVTRVDGNPDNCGNPPVPTPVYNPGDNVVNDNVTYVDNSNNSVTIPVVLAFGYASLNIDGTINVPIKAEFNLNPELNFNADFNLSTGGFTIDLSNPSTPRPPSCSDPNGYEPDPTVPAPPPEIPDAEPPETTPEEPADPEKVITACIVTTQLPGANESVIEQDNDVDIYVPALGYVQFLIRTGSSSAWTNDIPVKNKRCFIPCPWEGGAIDVRGTGRFENSITVTPIYGISQISNGFPD